MNRLTQLFGATLLAGAFCAASLPAAAAQTEQR